MITKIYLYKILTIYGFQGNIKPLPNCDSSDYNMLKNHMWPGKAFFISNLYLKIRRQAPGTVLLFSLWLASLVGLPIANYLWGDPALSMAVICSVIIQVGLVYTLLRQSWGLRQSLLTTFSVMLTALAIEALGTATGFPFGSYYYTDKLQPQIAHVPLLIPLAWVMMIPSAWTAAYCITHRWTGLRFVVVSGLAMTAWDLFLDPQMVAWGFWVWTEPGGYFGIPWQNFLGWFLTTALITIIVRPSNLPVAPLLALYIITWLLETLGLLFFWNLPGPAIIGFVAMGSLIWLAVKTQQRSRG